MATDTERVPSIQADIDGQLAAIEGQIRALWDIGSDRQRRELEELLKAAGPGGGILGSPAGAGDEYLNQQEKAALNALYERANRLRRLQKWMTDDPELIRMVDAAMANHVKAAEERQRQLAKTAQRRQVIISACVSVLSLIVGWLLSAISPVAALAHVLGH